MATTEAPLAFAGDGTSVSGSLAPGGSVEITLVFDCSQTSSFTEDVVVSVTTSDGTTSQTYTITGNVNP